MLRALVCIVLLTSPASADDGGDNEGRDLMAEALRLFMKGLMDEMEPALDDFSLLLENIDTYHPPEVLPNGDIIIRRKHPLPIENDEIEL